MVARRVRKWPDDLRTQVRKCDAWRVLRFNNWDVTFWPGGWARAIDETGVTITLRLLPVGEGDAVRLRVHATLMSSAKPVTARMWRDVPLAEIEQHVMIWGRVKDLRPHFEAMLQPSEIESLQSEDLVRYFEETEPLPVGSSIPRSTLVADDGEPRADFTLIRPPDGRISNEFLENLAEMYRWAVESGKAPAPAIANTANAPVRTVHRWVAEARKRGFLPPAIRGKAG